MSPSWQVQCFQNPAYPCDPKLYSWCELHPFSLPSPSFSNIYKAWLVTSRPKGQGNSAPWEMEADTVWDRAQINQVTKLSLFVNNRPYGKIINGVFSLIHARDKVATPSSNSSTLVSKCLLRSLEVLHLFRFPLLFTLVRLPPHLPNPND